MVFEQYAREILASHPEVRAQWEVTKIQVTSDSRDLEVCSEYALLVPLALQSQLRSTQLKPSMMPLPVSLMTLYLYEERIAREQ